MRRVLAIAGVLAVLLGLLTSTASASTIAGGTPARSVATRAVAGPPDAATTAVRRTAACYNTYNFHGHKKNYPCGTGYKWYDNAGGVERAFLIGSDHHVWNIFYDPGTRTVSGWHSLGGYAKRGVWDHWVAGAAVGIRVIGSDDRSWCKALKSRGWTGWYKC
jgi:hypothetical protein